jgi:hypothetical protein
MSQPETFEYGLKFAMEKPEEKIYKDASGKQRRADGSYLFEDMKDYDPNLMSPEVLAQKRELASFNRTAGPAKDPAAVLEWKLYSGLAPEKQEQYLAMKRAAVFKDHGSGFSRMSQTGQFGPELVLEKDLAPEDTPEVKAAQTSAVAMAKADADRSINRTKIESKLAGHSKKTEMLDGLISEAKELSGFWTTGFLGSKLKDVPQTPAFDLNKKLETIKANIGFDKLQEMRDNSPTGGALGQVSEFENRLLQAVWGNLEQSQSKEEFEKNLDLVREQAKASWANISKAYEKDYGEKWSGESPPQDPLQEEMKRRGLK